MQREVAPASEKGLEGWNAAVKLTLMLECAGFNATELSAYCRERGLFPQQADRWRQTAQDANTNALLIMEKQRVLQKHN